MVKTEHKKIGDYTFTTTQFAARRALRLQALMMKSGFDGGNTDKIDVDKADQLYLAMLELTAVVYEVDKQPRQVVFSGARAGESFDTVFSGDNLAMLIPVFKWVTEVNFGNFASGAGEQPSPTDTTPGA